MKNEAKTNKKHKLLKITAIVLAVLISFFLVTLITTPLVMVHPNHDEEAYNQLSLIELSELMVESRPLNVPLVEDVSIPTDYGTLYGWVLHQSSNTYSGNYDLLIYFGGREDNSSTDALRLFKQKSEENHFQNVDVAVIDWPGYGLSEGNATESTMKEAACSICNYFKAEKNISRVFVCGYSLGCGPAIYAASKCDVDGLILVAPYHSAYDLYNRYTPVFYGPMRLLITFKMEAYKFAENVSLKPLIIYSKSDSVIPNESSLNLASHFKQGYESVVITDAAHGDLMKNNEVLDAIDIFLNNQ